MLWKEVEDHEVVKIQCFSFWEIITWEWLLIAMHAVHRYLFSIANSDNIDTPKKGKKENNRGEETSNSYICFLKCDVFCWRAMERIFENQFHLCSHFRINFYIIYLSFFFKKNFMCIAFDGTLRLSCVDICTGGEFLHIFLVIFPIFFGVETWYSLLGLWPNHGIIIDLV